MRLHRIAAIFLCLIVPLSVSAPAQSPEEDAAELHAYVLNMDNVTRVYTAMHDIKLAAEKDPDLQKKMSGDEEGDKDSQSLASITAKFSAYPSIVAIIAKYHFTPHEFVVAQLSVVQAAMALAALKMGAPKDKLLAQGGVNAANLDFVQQHQSELEELGKKYPMQ